RDAYERVERGDLDGARTVLDEAMAREADPALLFVRGTIEQQAGNCAAAIDYLERFIASDPDPVDADAAREAAAACAPAPEPTPALPTPAPATAPAPPPRAAVVDPPPPDDRRTRARKPVRDPWGVGLLGAGSVLAFGGAAMLVGAEIATNRGDRSATEGAFAVRVGHARRVHWAGVGVLVTGVAVAIAGAVRYGLVARRDRSRRSLSARGPRRERPWCIAF
ncbi:MAG TPA: hypothetical protein VFG69_02860, partial [Nannocystaceae bacterium]|nr:hypothetical protein [Nannocystaceae bacterium]